MSTIVYTSNERAQERLGEEYPLCCGQTPLRWHWPKKGFVAIVCQNPQCVNHAGILGYGENDARDRWSQYRIIEG